MPELVDAAFNFLFQQSSECATSVGPSTPDGVDSIIVKTTEDLIALSCEQPMPKVGSNKTEIWQLTFFKSYQVLEYMRTDVSVAGQPVLAVVLGDVISSLHFTPHQIRMSIEKGKYGQKQVVKDFLVPGDKGIVVKRHVNNKRRKCDTILLSKIDRVYSEQLIAGN